MNAIRWLKGRLEILDQTELPGKVVYLKDLGYKDIIDAICEMKVRGAPAIGVAAAYGLAMSAQELECENKAQFLTHIKENALSLVATRPTAINLQWAINRLLDMLEKNEQQDIDTLKEMLLKEAYAIYREDLKNNRRLSKLGQLLIPSQASILTHCNAGALATTGFGTALGVIKAAWKVDKTIQVYVGETRPLLQGARLTTWELMREKIPVTLITDSMAGYLMAYGKVNLVLVGADRIAPNGDVANKIGTYSLAVLAKEHRIPFFVAAPCSTIDLSITGGWQIPIENRDSWEVTSFAGHQTAPPGVKVWNPAFDVTPNRFITAIITEKGIAYSPYELSMPLLYR